MTAVVRSRAVPRGLPRGPPLAHAEQASQSGDVRGRPHYVSLSLRGQETKKPATHGVASGERGEGPGEDKRETEVERRPGQKDSKGERRRKRVKEREEE